MKRKFLFIIMGLVLLIIVYYVFSFLSFFEKYGKHRIGDIEHQITVTSEFGGFSMSIPKAWHMQDVKVDDGNNLHLAVIFTTSNPRAYVNVYKLPNLALSETDIFALEMQMTKDLNSYTHIFTGNKKYGSYEGFVTEYTFKHNALLGEYLDHCYSWIITDESGYIFVFCADEEIWQYAKPMFFQMLTTIQLF